MSAFRKLILEKSAGWGVKDESGILVGLDEVDVTKG
jgi:hypothetical protein